MRTGSPEKRRSRHPRHRVLVSALLLPLTTGCSMGGTYTIVEKHVEPRHFKFVDIVPKRGKGPGGWRAACVHLRLEHKGGPFYWCKFGVEMPMENQRDGPISLPLAQRIAADCANLAADATLSATTPETPLGIACQSFKSAFSAALWRAATGSQVVTLCRKEAVPQAAP